MDRGSTTTQRFATVLLGRPVHAWIAEQRAGGSTWRAIADDLRIATDGQIDVTSEAVRLWWLGRFVTIPTE